MPVSLEYHDDVGRSVKHLFQRSIPLSLALFGVPFLILTSQAQISSSAGSAHSGSFAPSTAISAAPPTGAVAPRTGAVAPPTGATVGRNGFTHPTNPSHFPNGSHGNGHRPHRTANGTAYYPYVYALPVPYAVDTSDAGNSDDDSDDDAEYQGGPTIFDRRGSGPDSYIPPSSPGPAHARNVPAESNSNDVADSADAAPEPPQPPTTLVFKDGHQLEVNNYAIVGQILFDLTSGHPRKIALADLDLSATQKQNDDRGVVFQLPPTAQAN